MDRIIRVADSKNGEPREIPFNAEIETALREQLTKRRPGCEKVCYRVNRRGHAEPIGDFRKVWRRVCIELGLGKWEVVTDKSGKPVMKPPRYANSTPSRDCATMDSCSTICAAHSSRMRRRREHRGTKL